MVYLPILEIEPFITVICVFTQALVMRFSDVTNEYRINAKYIIHWKKGKHA